MVGAKSSGELAWTVEDTLNRVISGTVSLNTEIQRYVQTVFNIYRFKLVHDFKVVQKHLIDLKPLVLLGQQLQQQQSPEPALYELLNLANTLTHDDVQTGLELIDGVEDAIDDTIAADQVQQDIEPVLASIETEQDEVLAKETLAIFPGGVRRSS